MRFTPSLGLIISPFENQWRPIRPVWCQCVKPRLIGSRKMRLMLSVATKGGVRMCKTCQRNEVGGQLAANFSSHNSLMLLMLKHNFKVGGSWRKLAANWCTRRQNLARRLPKVGGQLAANLSSIMRNCARTAAALSPCSTISIFSLVPRQTADYGADNKRFRLLLMARPAPLPD